MFNESLIDPDDIELIYEIGKGLCGRVYESKVKLIHKVEIVACKVITIAKINEMKKQQLSTRLKKTLEMYSTPNGYDKFVREISAFNEIKGENVLKLIGYSVQTVENLTNLMILTEYMNKGSLRLLLAKEPNLSYHLRLNITCDIISGINQIHDLNFIHCDIKEDNILITHDYRAKIGDLGSVEKVGNKHQIDTTKLMPPEYQTGNYDQKLDIFMFGLTLNRLYNGTNNEELRQDDYCASILEEANVFSDIIFDCLNQKPAMRPTSSELKLKFFKYRKEINDFIAKADLKSVTNESYVDLIQRITILIG